MATYVEVSPGVMQLSSSSSSSSSFVANDGGSKATKRGGLAVRMARNGKGSEKTAQASVARQMSSSKGSSQSRMLSRIMAKGR